MQECASQIYKEHYNMIKRDIDKQYRHKFSTSITNKIDRDIYTCDITKIRRGIFHKDIPLMSIRPTHGQKEHEQHIAHKLHARSHILITISSQTPTRYLMSCQSHRAMCPLLNMRLLIGEHDAMV
jgi:hypothetical protein